MDAIDMTKLLEIATPLFDWLCSMWPPLPYVLVVLFFAVPGAVCVSDLRKARVTRNDINSRGN